MDNLFRVELLSQTPQPQKVIYTALRQDYSESFAHDQMSRFPSEEDCGHLAIKHLLAGNRGHYGPLEHTHISLNCGWFPHSVMQQARTHRLLSFDVQSGRYTGKRILAVAQEKLPIEEVFYLRPVGIYSDRQGKHYEYIEDQRERDLACCLEASRKYAHKVLNCGFAEEHARDLAGFNVRQHFVMSGNMRSLIHFLVIRGKKDAQLEIQQLCELILPHFQNWSPQIYDWFYKNQWQKGRLAP